MNRLFSLVKGLLRTAPESFKIMGKLSLDALVIEKYMIRAGLAGVSGPAARQYLSDEIENRMTRGLCGHIRCAAPRAELNWRLANSCGSTAIPAQLDRAATQETAWTTGEAALPATQLPGAAPAELRCLVCWGPMTGADCLNCRANGWPLLPSFDTAVMYCVTCEAQIPFGMGDCPRCTAAAEHGGHGLERLREASDALAAEPVTQCLGCGNPMVPGMNCTTCTAAVSDVWAFQQLDTGLLDDLPHLCHHDGLLRWVLLNGDHWAHCPDCGFHTSVAWPQIPEPHPMWVWPDGSVTEDV